MSPSVRVQPVAGHITSPDAITTEVRHDEGEAAALGDDRVGRIGLRVVSARGMAVDLHAERLLFLEQPAVELVQFVPVHRDADTVWHLMRSLARHISGHRAEGALADDTSPEHEALAAVGSDL